MWCLDGQTIFCLGEFPNLSPSFRSVMLNLDGEVVDTFPYGVGMSSCRGDKIATRTGFAFDGCIPNCRIEEKFLTFGSHKI
jgi:hypothetical protein